ncbi:MAG: glycosyltransferase [Saprospiraceae bacterium]|nr:glycosyltransferase [Saprospiraceae bacterium]
MSLFFLLCLLFILQLTYPFLSVLAARFFSSKPGSALETPVQYDFACVITAYRNAEIARPLVASLIGQQYPNWMVYWVVDECPDFQETSGDSRVLLLRPEPPLRLKAKSIIYALAHFQRPHDYVVVFDADNLAHPDFLAAINRMANRGFSCIQGQRTAKNLDTDYAALDSLGEHYKNYIEREIPFRLGGSAVISGSGMATATHLYRAYLASPEIEQGKQRWKKMLQEDKILQNFLLRRGERIAYAREAVVYDEKVDSGAAVETQRSRWLYSYFQNIPNALGILRRGIIRLNFNQLYFGFVTLVLPLFIQLGTAVVLMTAAFLFAPAWGWALAAALAVFALNIGWVLYLDQAPPEVWRVCWKTPRFMWRQLRGLFKMRNPNKHFTHTTHHKSVSVEDVLKKKREKPD